jgi:hypothetical protein
VVKDFKQIHGIDYDETFSPIMMLKFVRILLAIAAYFDYEIWQMNCAVVFLVLYVDDILLIRNDIPMMEVIKS